MKTTLKRLVVSLLVMFAFGALVPTAAPPAILALLPSAPQEASAQVSSAPDAYSGCNSYGCWERGGGCNSYGCWTNRGGCNSYGCWYGPRGSCNSYGCSNIGTCNSYGCPSEGDRRGDRDRRRRR